MITDKAAEKLIIALDFSAWEEAQDIVRKLPRVSLFKVGLELYLSSRGEAVTRLRELGKEVFLDLKFHDIPHTVAAACRQAVMMGAFMFNVHALGGKEMMRQAVLAKAVASGRQPLLLAVTILTSLNDEDLLEIGQSQAGEAVGRLAFLAKEAGADGVVASPREIGLIRELCGPDFKIVCPGVRPVWAGAQDQKRVLAPKEAIAQGADYLVVGRPVTRAENPGEAADRILAEIEEALRNK